MGDSFGIFSADDTAGLVDQAMDDTIDVLYDVDQSIASQAFSAITWIWDTLKAIFSWLGGIFSALWDFFKGTLHWLFHTLLPDLIKWINEIRAKLTKWLKPVTKWIHQQQVLLDNYYNHVLRPILNIMQRLRSILVIFRLLHIKWADALDKWLAGLENELVQRFQEERADLQALANWINYIVDPTGLFNLPLLLVSQIQTLGCLFAALFGKQQSAWTPADTQAQDQDANSGHYEQARQEVIDRGSFPTAYDLSRHSDIVNLYQLDGYKAF
jgi:hypothetical protein